MPAVNPSTKNWIIFSLLLAGTLVTTYLAGGFLFSISLILILGTHEFGHYWASRKNNVRATLPFFIPAPPIFIAGTFGAFIQIKELIPDRRVLMEIGSAGPIAGFIVAVPTLVVGLFLSEVTPAETVHGMTFGSSILLTVLSKLILGVTPFTEGVNINLHPIAFAGWIGLFVTALNLLPIGQLDGGHVVYSLFVRRHKILSRLFFILMLPLGYFWQGWWFWAVMIALMGFRPAPLIDDSILPDPRHRAMGYVSIFIFLLTFIPVPFSVT
ncbi:Zinc metalloprotease [hydrothermal vent metagenome]|uniref:Zinc metalloprotease n=1 Tax=hydrothermal vent metagenome TaxID=652676 RepID=A0A3B1D862_9ZZZZ